MAATHSAWVRQASLKESERKRKRQLLKINISPEMRSVFVCMYHFDDNNPFDSLYMCVRVCVYVFLLHYSEAISLNFTPPPHSNLLEMYACICAFNYRNNTLHSIDLNLSMSVGGI